MVKVFFKANLFDNQPLQNVHHEPHDSWISSVRLNNSSHEEDRDVGQLHKLLQYDGQDFLRVDLLLLKAKLGGLQHCSHILVTGRHVDVVQGYQEVSWRKRTLRPKSSEYFFHNSLEQQAR